MTRVRVRDIESGMVLFEDVFDKNGRFMLGKGVELAQKHIMAFKAWGIGSVEVEGGDPELMLEEINRDVSDERMQQIHNEVAERFRFSNTEHVFIKALMEKVTNLLIVAPPEKDNT